MSDAKSRVRKSGCPAISIVVTFCPSYEGKMSVVCGDVLGVSLFACAIMARGAPKPRATSSVANRIVTRAAAEFAETRTPRCALVRKRTECASPLLLIPPHCWMQAASAAVLRHIWPACAGWKIKGVSRVPGDAESRVLTDRRQISPPDSCLDASNVNPFSGKMTFQLSVHQQHVA